VDEDGGEGEYADAGQELDTVFRLVPMKDHDVESTIESSGRPRPSPSNTWAMCFGENKNKQEP
jgi:hypothetical protein